MRELARPHGAGRPHSAGTRTAYQEVALQRRRITPGGRQQCGHALRSACVRYPQAMHPQSADRRLGKARGSWSRGGVAASRSACPRSFIELAIYSGRRRSRWDRHARFAENGLGVEAETSLLTPDALPSGPPGNLDHSNLASATSSFLSSPLLFFLFSSATLLFHLVRLEVRREHCGPWNHNR